eukprot:TRINITY_DN4238_c0_g1_i2.p1 TRINITY_DN4238_c0_g1~~TRINITY_DN4238_c0_g1_i2.p1  ORF type:complete len:1586 (-),score=325.19 TRINITY_DN4238_c0_g1_i2:86-4822(-)
MKDTRVFLTIIFLSLFIVKIAAFGSNIFYARFLLTNQEFGSGAAFQAQVWFNANIQKMRLDYFQIGSSSPFMSVYYDYSTKNQYQVCGSSCSRATYITPMPNFLGDTSTYRSAACETPDYPGPRACVAACTSYIGTPPAPQGIYSLSYNDTAANTLCLVRFTVQSGKTYGPEWQIQQYLTSGWTAAQNPTTSSTYTNVIAGVNCPSPTCFAELDVAIAIDESGSIFAANAWPDVQNFVLNLIGGFNIGTQSTRVGLTYFSGLEDCYSNWTGTASVPCQSKNNNDPCVDCGGRWQQMTTGVITSKSALVNLVNSNPGAKGFTCISCGIDVGIKILNFAPKANIGKVIILMTDGAANRVTDGLVQNAKYAYDMGISIIAIGVGPYKLSDLQQITTNDKIFTTANYNQLSTLIQSIVTPLCQPLPAIESCDFCSGLCTCQANCNCPNCNDFNACTNDNCDIRQPPQGTSGICTHSVRNCNDNNPCTIDTCNNSTGCDYSQLTPRPGGLVDTFCIRYSCRNPQGWTTTDMGSSLCPASSNKCIINYCNTTVGTTSGLTGSCQTINLTDPAYPYGTSVTYRNSGGQTLTVAGCGKPSNAPACAVYGCVTNTGACTIDVSACGCYSGADCYDGNGCTHDICSNGVCSNPVVDCYSILSNGRCVMNQATNTSSDLGDAYYNGTLTTSDFQLDSSNLPVVGNYSCATLACYRFVRNSFTCVARSQTTFQCQRSVSSCSSSACTDSVCRSLNTWTSNRLNTDCGKTYSRTCNDFQRCTSDVCNPSFSGTTCSNTSCLSGGTAARCVYASNATLCNDGRACTIDSCDNSTGCSYFTPPIPPTNYCLITGCNNSTGNFSRINTTRCAVSNDLCVINYCDVSSTSCQTIDKRALAVGTNVTYTDGLGVVRVVYGCAGNATNNCTVYGCSNGNCFVDSSTCPCANNSVCDDGNGCTNDICNSQTGKCENIPVDCFSELSNGLCVTNASFTGTNATGLYYYNIAIATNNSAYPAFVNGSYNCDQLACYGGQRSTYSCVATGKSTHTCARATQDCSKGGCQDNLCRTLGTWLNGQIQTDYYIYAGGLQRCIEFSNASNCEDNNVCTTDSCSNTTGCINTFIAPPGPNSTCYTYTCDRELGFSKNNVGPTSCPTSTVNLCHITYCNSTTNQCVSIKKEEIPVGTIISYTDSDGSNYTVAGCMNPGDPVLCREYGCNQTTGQCYTSTATCKCTSNSSCEDGTGCTIDVCDYQLNQCNRTVIDCFDILSNGSCPQGAPTSLDIFTSIDIYYGNVTVPNNFTQYDSSGLPFPSTGVKRTCGQLACYNGQPSQYSCFSLAEGTYTCQRTYTNCSRNGCLDNICRSLGSWTDGQLNTDCNTTFVPQCADANACTNDFCNSAWIPSQPVAERCLHIFVNESSFCDDGNFCTKDYCDGQDTTGNPCKHSLYSESWLRKNICKTNTSMTCKTVTCNVNKCIYTDYTCLAPNLCLFYTCNATTNGVCKQFPTGIYSVDKCGVCGGNGLSCVPTNPGNPKKTSIAVALGVGLGIGLFVAAAIIAAITKRSFDAYNALAVEQQGSVTTSPVHESGIHHIDTTHYD